MGKKNRKQEHSPEPAAAPDKGLSSRGKKVIALGVVILAAGFLVLTRTDPRGQNWASLLSPLLILGGYAVVAIGILTPDPDEPSPFAPPTLPPQP